MAMIFIKGCRLQGGRKEKTCKEVRIFSQNYVSHPDEKVC